VVAVQVGDGTADGHGDDDEGDEDQEVEAGHDEEAHLRAGPVEGDADEGVEGGE
jgi:hypothetical protein